MYFFRHFLPFVMLLQSAILCAQTHEISLRHFNTSLGLTDNNIRCMLFDSRGFMWLGTNEGLNRFDGKEFTAIKRTDKGKFSLSGNVITDILEDRDGTLWVATRDGGICSVNTRTGEIFHPILPVQNGGEQSYAHCIYQDDAGQLYVGTDKGIYWSKDHKSFFAIPDIGSLACYDIEAYNGKIYAALNVKGLCEISKENLVELKDSSSVHFPHPAHSLNEIFIDKQNNCWIAAWDNFLHLYQANPQKFTHLDFLHRGAISYEDDEIRSITEAQPGKLWLAMKSGEVYEYTIASHETHRVEFSKRETTKLNGRRIYFLHTDALFRTWIGTDSGLHLYDPSSTKFNIVTIAGQPIVTDFIEENKDLIFSTTQGVYYNSPNSSTYAPFGNAVENVYSICKTPGFFAIGTNTSLFKKSNGLQTYIPLTNQKRFFIDLQHITSSRYNDLAMVTLENNPLLFASAYGHGIVIIDPTTGLWNLGIIKTQNGIDNLTREIHQDSRNRIWFLGSNGLAKLDFIHSEKSMDSLRHSEYLDPQEIAVAFQSTCFNNALLSKEVTSMCEKQDGNFWISTQGAGLYHFNPDDIERPFTAIPSPSQSMQQMCMDHHGDLWIVASGGLLNFNTTSNKWVRYTDRDGIPADGLSGAIFTKQNGDVVAGGNGFYLTFNPDHLSANVEAPKPVITHISIMDVPSDSLLFAEKIILPHTENFISIDFASLCFSDPASVVYQYKLEGLDVNWRDNGNINKVSYSDLSPGEYTFHVKAMRPGMQEQQGEASLHIRILQPFYFRWWFIVLVLILVILFSWLFIRYRIAQQNKLATMRNKIARDLHDDIGSALGSISFFSETAKRTLDDKNTSGTNHVLNKIGSTSREMIENMHDIVWAVNPANDAFSQITDRMRSYAADMASANDIRLYFNSAIELHHIKLSMDERKNIFLIFKEAVYNSCKYSRCSQLRITLNKSAGHRLVLTVSDNGSGFETKNNSSGNGLRNMKSRAMEIDGEFEIKSELGHGTTIRVSLH